MRGAWIGLGLDDVGLGDAGSLPMRGAWIGIIFLFPIVYCGSVAPHAGSVDWNLGKFGGALIGAGRSPCGERGLEFTST